MAAKHRSKATKLTGPRGPRGKAGRAGPAGPAANGELRRLAAQVNEVVTELQVQLTRIAQIQAQLDRLASGHSPESKHRDEA
jgi:hypothetical protein